MSYLLDTNVCVKYLSGRNPDLTRARTASTMVQNGNWVISIELGNELGKSKAMFVQIQQ